MDMIADRVLATRAATSQEHDEEGRRVNRTLGMASLGGATLGAAPRRGGGEPYHQGLAGSACERWAVYKAGFQRPRPRYIVAPQRARMAERKRWQLEP
jgi:hypothetical protein